MRTNFIKKITKKTKLSVCEKCLFATDKQKIKKCNNCGTKLLIKLIAEPLENREILCEQIINNETFSTRTKLISKGIFDQVDAYLWNERDQIIIDFLPALKPAIEEEKKYRVYGKS